MTSVEANAAGKELARRTRKQQGLPARVRDRQVVQRVVALLVNGKATP
jgi:hypothetical protein